MSRRTYTLVPQRLEAGRGYVPCQPHQACRFVVQEIANYLKPQPHRVTRNAAIFHGAGALIAARKELDRRTRGTMKRTSSRPAPYARSLTLKEYNEVIAVRNQVDGDYEVNRQMLGGKRG